MSARLIKHTYTLLMYLRNEKQGFLIEGLDKTMAKVYANRFEANPTCETRGQIITEVLALPNDQSESIGFDKYPLEMLNCNAYNGLLHHDVYSGVYTAMELAMMRIPQDVAA